MAVVCSLLLWNDKETLAMISVLCLSIPKEAVYFYISY